MRREFSAGGVAIRRLRGEWVFAAIRPRGKKPGIWALPKGRNAQSELAEAMCAWQGAFHVKRSVTDEDSYIVVGTGVRART